jgi:hypothetical protein
MKNIPFFHILVLTGIFIERQNIPCGSSLGTGYNGKEARGKGQGRTTEKKHSQQ